MAQLNVLHNVTGKWSDVKADLFAIGVFKDKSISKIGEEIDKTLGNKITTAIKNGDILGKAEETTLFYEGERRILVLGLGEKKEFDLESLRCAGGQVIKTALAKKIKSVAMEVFGEDNTSSKSQAIAEGVILGSYQYLNYKTDTKDLFEVESAALLNGNKKGVDKGVKIALGVCLARDLGNHPGNQTTPSFLAETADLIAKDGKMKLTVFDRDEFTKMGMGAFAGVAQGSDEPPKFIITEYWGDKKSEKPIILVGKGLTFDSGGISIKPAANMDEMKFDMCGSAVVLGVMKSLALLKPKMNVIGIVPSTENMSGGKAVKPGDILNAYNGKTIEVLNTDAEGRLILADALAYASKHYDPKYILDFATLTGAVLITLGHIATGIMGTDEKLIDQVKTSSSNTAEKVWELPLWDEFAKQVKSKIADVKNMGEARQAGTIAGGVFLKEFVKEGIPWVHFDIAGTAWGGKPTPYMTKEGASGAVIRLVLDMMNV
jgi:leucyl aminopeptidase